MFCFIMALQISVISWPIGRHPAERPVVPRCWRPFGHNVTTFEISKKNKSCLSCCAHPDCPVTTFVFKQQTNILQIFEFQKLLGHAHPAITEKYVAKSLPMQIDTGLRLLGMGAVSDAPDRLLRAVPEQERSLIASTVRERSPSGSIVRERSPRASKVRERSPRASPPQLKNRKRTKLSLSGYRASISVQGSYL
jgi:hypothetical protein